MSSPSVTKVGRPTLYYGKYTYTACVPLPQAYRLHHADTYEYLVWLVDDELLKSRTSGRPFRPARNQVNLAMFERYFAWVNTNTEVKKTIRVKTGEIHVYCNDLGVLQQLEAIHNSTVPIRYTEVFIDTPAGVKYLTDPAHPYRVYLKPQRITREQKSELVDIISRYKNTSCELFPSGAFNLWLNKRIGIWLPSGSFIEYDNPSTYLVLTMLVEKLIFRKFEMHKRP